MNKTLVSRNKTKLLRRFERLLIPYIIFPILVMAINNYIDFKFKLKYKNLKTSFLDLKIQLLSGSGFLKHLWYIFDLLLFTFIFVIIITIFNSKYLFALNSLTVICYIFLCSGYNKRFFSKIKHKYYQFPLKKIAVMFPFAVLGFTIFSLKLVDKLKNFRFTIIYFSSVILYVINKYRFFNKIAEHPNSNLLFFFGSPLLFFIFILLPTEFIKKNKAITNIFKECTKNTMGVYLLHVPICVYLRNHITIIKFKSKPNFSNCLKIYIISYYISFVCSKIFKNSKIRHLFM